MRRALMYTLMASLALFATASHAAAPGQKASCIPINCYGYGYNCGTASDGCGGTLDCGACPRGQGCTHNVCYPAQCTPKTCHQGGANCGLTGDGRGGTLNPRTPPK